MPLNKVLKHFAWLLMALYVMAEWFIRARLHGSARPRDLY